MGDLDGNQVVDVGDLTTLLMSWGNCPAAPDPCPADFNENGRVDVDDLITLITVWGACPGGGLD